MNNIDQDPLFLWQAALVCSGTSRGGVVEPAAWTKCRVQSDGLPMRWSWVTPKNVAVHVPFRKRGMKLVGVIRGTPAHFWPHPVVLVSYTVTPRNR